LISNIYLPHRTNVKIEKNQNGKKEGDQKAKIKPCCRDVPLHCGSLHFGEVQENIGNEDT